MTFGMVFRTVYSLSWSSRFSHSRMQERLTGTWLPVLDVAVLDRIDLEAVLVDGLVIGSEDCRNTGLASFLKCVSCHGADST